MAMMDDVEFLVMHLRNSFITSDDTGMCEMIMESEEVERHKHTPVITTSTSPMTSDVSDSGMESSDGEMSHSYDILPDMDYGAHRRRSNTAVRLDKLKKEKKSQVKVKHISWRGCSFSDKENVKVFERKKAWSEDNKAAVRRKKCTSLLSDLLDTYSVVSSNPFMEFSKFDGRANLGVPTKKIDIYLTMASPRDRPFPMTVVIVSSAKVRDLIGYICWQYTSEGREPPLLENSHMYTLHIAEDDGEVDTDFPCLNIKEPVSKFGFSKLALVEKAPVPTSYATDSIVVTINIPGKGFSKVPVDDLDVPLRDILQRVVMKRKMITRPGVEYNLEKQEEPGVNLDLDITLNAFDDYTFCLVRCNSCRGDLVDSGLSDMTDSFSSHRYKTFVVSMCHKLRANSDVQLGISGNKIDIDPVSHKTANRLFRFKAMTLDVDSIVSCHTVDEKSSGCTSFRITYVLNNEHKHLDFESLNETASQIVLKLTNILEWKFSPSEPKVTPVPKDRRSARKRDIISQYLT